MQAIALISQKGGVGKTTVAIHLATSFAAAGYNTLLLDLDPQASAAGWKDAREDETPPVMTIPASRLPRVAEEVRGVGTDILILDTAPHSEGTALDAARIANLILVPCQPSIMDLRAMRTTTNLLHHIRKPTYAVLNGVAAQGNVADEAVAAISEEFGLAVCPHRLGDRVAFNRCLITGQTAPEYEPTGKAAAEALALYKWICKLVSLPCSKEEAA